MISLIGRGILSAVKSKSPSYILCARMGYIKFTDPLEHATGLEKKQLLAIQSGNEDPFGLRVVKKGPGTKEQPNEVPSVNDRRLVGCICEEDSTHINYMWVHKDDPKRCECGYWFKLVDRKPL